MALVGVRRTLALGTGVGWWKASQYLLDGVAPVVDADFSRQRFMLGGVSKQFSDLFTLSSVAKYVVNASGVLTQVPANTPAYDYSTGRGRLLLEGAATNAMLHSTDLTATGWNSFAVSSVSNVTGTAPDGTTTVTQIVTSGLGGRYQGGLSVTSGTAYTSYGLFKWISGPTTLQLEVANQVAFGGSGGDRIVQFNGQTGAFIASSTEIGSNYKIIPLANGWFWVQATFTPTSTSSGSDAVGLFASQSGTTFQGWGAGRVTQAFASSVILTTAAAVTRAADSCQLTTAVKAYLTASQTSVAVRGQLYTVVVNNTILGGSSTQWMQPANNTTGRSYNGTVAFNCTFGGGSFTTGYGLALASNSSTTELAANGGATASNAASSSFVSPIYLGSGGGVYGNGYYDEISIWTNYGSSAGIQSQARVWQ